MGGMHSGSSEAGDEHNAADAMFAQMMVPHHEQAVQMSGIMLAKNGLDTQIVDLANKIKAAQEPEVEKMNSWLQAWGGPVMADGSMDHPMEDMMGEDDLSQLEVSKGDEATRLFLTQVIAHHKGAVKMAEEEVADGSSQDAVDLAKKIVADQEAVIKTMEDLLAGYRQPRRRAEPHTGSRSPHPLSNVTGAGSFVAMKRRIAG